MNNEDNPIYEEQKRLVLARLKTLNLDAKIMFGGKREISVNDLISNIEKDNDFGREIVKVQMNMLRILAGGD